jgi:hypothetical protein
MQSQDRKINTDGQDKQDKERNDECRVMNEEKAFA